MMRRIGAALAISVSLAACPAWAAELPQIMASPQNKVPECATPGRMMAYLESRNGKLNPRYSGLATEYMRHGEDLGLRWDIAFFQMLLETGNLSYTGDVKPDQNNFAGLGATGRGARGESFKDISTGVQAHLEHVLMYAGGKVDNPVAERTRNVQEWGVLTKWQQSLKGPMTFTDLSKKWAPPDRGYSNDIAIISARFFEGLCNQSDPKPELVAEARKGRSGKTFTVAAGSPAPEKPADKIAAKSSPEELRPDAQKPEGKKAEVKKPDSKPAETKAAERAPPKTEDAPPVKLTAAATAKENAPEKSAANKTAEKIAAKTADDGPPVKLAAAAPTKETATEKPAAPTAKDPPSVKILNPAPAETPVAASPSEPSKTADPAAPIETASVAAAAKSIAPAATATEKAPEKKCRVWTASYGGQKAIIIKAQAGEVTNYTVLDVNDGKEQREADAYIAAYAKGGEKMQEFPSPALALEKAFNLCPEG